MNHETSKMAQVNETSQKPMLEMRKSSTSSSFKLTISSTLESKIRYLCGKFPETEWSGILFYKQTGGSFETKDMELSAEDFYLLDVGTACYTEYDPNPDVLKYQIDNELLDCWWSLCHSHNSMAAFFSGTDVNTLNKIGSTMNHCLSLIVNNKGEYCARMTRIVDESLKVDVDAKYKSFNDEEKKYTYTVNANKKCLEWIEAEIFKEEPRKLSKKETKAIDSLISDINAKKLEGMRYQPMSINDFSSYELDLFGTHEYSTAYRYVDTDDDYSPEKRIAYTLITGDMFPPKSAIKGSLDSVVKFAMRTYSIKKNAIRISAESPTFLDDYVQSVISYYTYLFDDENEQTEIYDDIASVFVDYIDKSEWINELYNSLYNNIWMIQ